jgi:hypothetical protein
MKIIITSLLVFILLIVSLSALCPLTNPLQKVVVGKEYTLIMCTDDCPGDCPSSYICKSSVFTQTEACCIGDNMPDCLDVCTIKEYACTTDDECCDHNCDNSHCCNMGDVYVTSCCSPGDTGCKCTASNTCTLSADWCDVANGKYCCPLGSEWDPVFKKCVAHDPCYSSSTSYINYCYFRANNAPSPQKSWWITPNTCIPRPSSQACCYVGTGLYGYVDPNSPYYYWHTEQAIVVY